MRSNKVSLNIRIRRLRNVILRAKHSVRRYRQDVTRTQRELARIEQLQRVMARGHMMRPDLGYFGRVPSKPNLQNIPSYFAAGTTLYQRPDLSPQDGPQGGGN